MGSACCYSGQSDFKEPFQAVKTPQLYFGCGSLKSLGKILNRCSTSPVALFTGESFLKKQGLYDKVNSLCSEGGRKILHFTIPSEPSPSMVDSACEQMRRENVSAVISIGGGSVIDAGKAASVMVFQKGSVQDFLEGVGTSEISGSKLPFTAVPTTSGTGSEATKNSVISSVGDNGFKKSLRHDCMVPDYVIIDPELIVSCPPRITAASGMDAVTQLLESFVSTKASFFTDSLAAPALMAAGRSLEKAYKNGSDISARSAMAWAAYVSGITLANAGLGVVHGIASPAGGFSSVPHGVVCGTLLLPATKYIIKRLSETEPEGAALRKYAAASALLTGREYGSLKDACESLLDFLSGWTERFEIPRLGEYGFDKNLAQKTAASSDGKNSPVRLDSGDIFNIIMDRV